MEKKKIVVVMNCAGSEISRYLISSPNITKLYDVEFFTTYVSMGDDQERVRLYDALAKADVVIAQNVQSIDWLRNDEMQAAVRPDCRFFRFAFWRFEGFWPLAQERLSNALWYLPIEMGEVADFDTYINAEIDPAVIRAHFDAEIERFAEIDAASELKMLPFLMNNLKTYQLFTDSWHPTSFFFHQVIAYIFSELGIPLDVGVFPDDNINKDRYRFIFNAVAGELGLNYDRTFLQFNEHVISRKVFFDFSRYGAAQLAQATSPTDAADLFNAWRQEIGLEAVRTDVAPLGKAAQSSLSPWSHPDDPQRAVSGAGMESGFAFHTDLDPAPWWEIDLKEFRQVREIAVWNRDGLQERSLPLAISTSMDGVEWRRLATANYPFGSMREGFPFRLEFAKPILSRFVRLQVTQPSYMHLGQVSVYSDIIS